MKISLLFPTRDRAPFLYWSLRTALEIDDDRLEIIVSDNCSLDDTADVVASFNDLRLKYIRTPERTSMRANFEFALRSSTGDYVSVIGDDDGYLPAQFPALRSILEKHQPDCLYWDLPAYTWPAEGESGLVKLRRRSAFGLPKAIDTDVFRENLLEARIEQTNWAPSVYHGVASRSYLERIACPDGTCFDGSIPDIYFSYRSLFAGGNMLRAAHPFSIAGQSNASNGAAQNGQKESAINKSFIADNKSDPYCDVVPQRRPIPWVLFSTMETVRARFPEIADSPNYEYWYRYILQTEPIQSDEWKAELDGALHAYAAQTGTEEDLKRAYVPKKIEAVGLWDKLRRELSNAERIKISSGLDGKDNIYSAAKVYDRLLKTRYAQVLDGSMSARAAWRDMKRDASK